MKRPTRIIAQRGQVLLEAIIALALFSLIVSAMMSLTLGSYEGLLRGGNQTRAEALANEAIEAIKSVRETGWNTATSSPSAVVLSGGHWLLTASSSELIDATFTRTITLADVCRDASHNIATCPAAYTDVNSKKVVVTVSWPQAPLVTDSVQRIAYLTNWDSTDWTQTDWSGGSGQAIWSIPSKYESDDSYLDIRTVLGQVSLLCGNLLDPGFEVNAGISTNDWPFTTASNYVYDPSKIEVTGGVAQLVNQATGGACSGTPNACATFGSQTACQAQAGCAWGSTGSGATTNGDFTSTLVPWASGSWGTATPTLSNAATGGNPTGYAKIQFPTTRNATSGGYFEQSFTTTGAASVAALNLDWLVSQYTGAAQNLTLYAFIDTAPGAPTIGSAGQVWSSGNITSTTAWATASNINVASQITGPGTYYLKIAAFVTYSRGGASRAYAVGFDNASLNWTEAASCSGTPNACSTFGSQTACQAQLSCAWGAATGYATDSPSISPTTSFTVVGPGSWTAFTETATKNGGEIYYQLSDDDGSTWQYWNGISWVSASSVDYNTASVVNANIGSFSAANQKIRFKAFLASDGTQLVQLDDVQITFTQSGSPWNFGVWDVSRGEVTPVGSHQTTGGNPNGNDTITVPNGRGDQVGGYWEQSFTSYRANPTPVTLSFDYRVTAFNGTPTTAEVRAYIDTAAAGVPVTQVGSAIPISGVGSWTSSPTYDLSSIVTAAGTYYLKLALWVDTGTRSGPFTVAFDNVKLDLGNGAYAPNSLFTSSAFNMGNPSPVQTLDWDQGTSTCASCAIRLQVRTAPDAGGSPGTWTSWFGAGGAGTFFTDHFGSLVSSLLNGNQWVQYRAELSGDGTGTPVLQEVRVNYK